MVGSPLSTLRWCALLLCLGLSALNPTSAQTYPQRPIRLVSPIPPGGAPDMIARALGAKLATQMGQAVVIENKIGSNGQAAAEYVARAAADGHTLLVGMDSLFAINPYVYTRSSVDVNKDLTPIATLGANQFVLAINPQLPVKNLTEFIALAKGGLAVFARAMNSARFLAGNWGLMANTNWLAPKVATGIKSLFTSKLVRAYT